MEQKRDPRQPGFDLPTDVPTENLPFNLRAKIISFQKGVPYHVAYGMMLEQEVREKAEERKESHSP